MSQTLGFAVSMGEGSCLLEWGGEQPAGFDGSNMAAVQKQQLSCNARTQQ